MAKIIRKITLLGVIIYIIMLSNYCFAGTVKVWIIGGSHKIDPNTGHDFNPFVPKNIDKRNYIWDSRTATIAIFGARNEFVPFQIIINAENESLDEVSVIFSDLRGPDIFKRNNIKLFKEHYTYIWGKSAWPLPSTGPGWYPDALVPFDAPKLGSPFSIKKGCNQAVWVDLFIPKGTVPGEYKGIFTVLAGNRVIKQINILLTVWNFTLPDENHLIAWSNYGSGDITREYGARQGETKYIAVEQNIWKIAHEHRMNALLRHAQIRPGLINNQYGLYQLDYQNYAYRLGSYLSGKMFKNKLPPDIFLLPLSGGTEYRWPPRGPSNDPDSGFAFACKDIAAYFHEMKWGGMLHKSYVYLSDETDENGLQKIVHDARIIHNADKSLKTMVALCKVFNSNTVKELSGSVDMWLVDASYYNHRLLNPRKAFGEKVGFYQQGEPWCGNENLDSDALGFRTWPWIAWKYKVDCIYMYYMNYWCGLESGHTIWDYPRTQSWSNSQGVLIYPGSYLGMTDVVSSIRLKELRQGMQDYEYMYLAKQKGADPDKIVNSIIIRALDEARRPGGSYGEWSHDPADWFKARANLANMILGKEAVPFKVRLPRPEPYIKSNSLKGSIRNIIRNVWLSLPNKIRHPKLLFLGKPNYFVNFSKGNEEGWYGGEIVYKDGKTVMQAKSDSKNKQFLWLETWKILPVKSDTKINITYYYKGSNPLILQFWSKTYKTNFSIQINNPVCDKWETLEYDMKDINPQLSDSQINSIHIATLNKPDTVLMLDKISLK